MFLIKTNPFKQCSESKLILCCNRNSVLTRCGIAATFCVVWMFLYLRELDIIGPEKTSFGEPHSHRGSEEINVIRIQDLQWDPNATRWQESHSSLTDSYRMRSRFNHTVVTSYFRIKSKHSRNEYNTWMRNILSMQDAMVIFTTPEEEERIKSYVRMYLVKQLWSQCSWTRLVCWHTTSNRTFWEIQHSKGPRERIS